MYVALTWNCLEAKSSFFIYILSLLHLFLQIDIRVRFNVVVTCHLIYIVCVRTCIAKLRPGVGVFVELAQQRQNSSFNLSIFVQEEMYRLIFEDKLLSASVSIMCTTFKGNKKLNQSITQVKATPIFCQLICWIISYFELK